MSLNIDIVGDSMINGVTPVELSSKSEHRSQIKTYGGAISEDIVNHIRPTLIRKTDVIAIHIGTISITNDNFSILQINLNKIRKLVTVLSSSTKIVLSSIILCHDKSNINVKVNRGNKIMKQFCKAN